MTYTSDEERFYASRTWTGPVPQAKTDEPKPHPLAGRTPGVRSTSRAVYHNEVKPTISAKQREVYVAIQMSKRPVNNLELSKYLGWPINSVTPRVNELVQLGKVTEAFRAVDPTTNRRSIYWKPVDKP